MPARLYPRGRCPVGDADIEPRKDLLGCALLAYGAEELVARCLPKSCKDAL